MTGHTTIVTLCGFAYGVWGFFLAAAGSLVGAMTTFVVLRFLFSKRLHNWTSNNKKWQALEAVVVSLAFFRALHEMAEVLAARQRSTSNDLDPHFSIPSVGLLQHPLCCKIYPVHAIYR
jgi:hypothetical protein